MGVCSCILVNINASVYRHLPVFTKYFLDLKSMHLKNTLYKHTQPLNDYCVYYALVCE
ncbi:hypothetical protein AB205_0085380 [Aquarana catesbeiana]|uniref:Uncharacterized protein n=1 Tax=Aquarana catesbeiana TaxID=8400 RepID=A0A2G9QJ06_AQUCT|nr:hypothetical protein AB205_0085380 [Aquarana catesbeiana]